MWRMNPSRLNDQAGLQRITKTIKSYFSENLSDELSPLIIWAAHKHVIRGALLSIGAKKKKRGRKKDFRINKQNYNFRNSP